MDVTLPKTVVVLAALYLAYIGYDCPCKPNIYSCHLTQMYVALVLIIAVLMYENGLRFTSY